MDFWPLVVGNLAIITMISFVVFCGVFFALHGEGNDKIESLGGAFGAAFLTWWVAFSLSTTGWIIFIVLHFVAKWW